MSNLIPLGMTYDELAGILQDISAGVRAGDSMEGSIEWHFPDDDSRPDPVPELWPTSDGADVWVHGVFRVGNLQGQGGMRIIGHIPPP